LNLLMRRDASTTSDANVSTTVSSPSSSPKGGSGGTSSPSPTRPRTNEEYVMDQIKAFRERYGSLPGYNYAEAYLDSILSLATTGNESPRVKEVCDYHPCLI
jgi:hypothetical protein